MAHTQPAAFQVITEGLSGLLHSTTCAINSTVTLETAWLSNWEHFKPFPTLRTCYRCTFLSTESIKLDKSVLPLIVPICLWILLPSYMMFRMKILLWSFQQEQKNSAVDILFSWKALGQQLYKGLQGYSVSMKFLKRAETGLVFP